MDIWRKLLNRMIRAARMDPGFYEEMETEEDALGHAVMVALLAAAATGIGAGLSTLVGGAKPVWFLWGLLSGFFASLLGWLLWAGLTLFSASTFLRGHEPVNRNELTASLGFANSAGMLRLFIFIPILGWLIILLSGILTLAAGTTAVRQTLEYTTGKAIATCLIGWLVYMALLVLVYLWLPSPYKLLPSLGS